MTALNAADPMVLDSQPLGRRAGAMIKVERRFSAPAGWAISSAAVPTGSPVDLQVRLEAVVEGVLVSGTAATTVVAECSRCLDEVRIPLVTSLQQLFEYPDLQQSLPAEAFEQEPLPTLVGDLLDLEPVVRDGIVLDLPLAPLCSPDCPGLCQTCGIRLADEPGHRHPDEDVRWAALADWAAATENPHEQPTTKGD